MDLKDMMRAAGELQKQLQQTQAKLHEIRVTGEAGAGLVRVTMDGQHQLLEVTIDPAAARGETALLEDLLRAAVNQATTRLAEKMQQNLGTIAQGLGVDLGGLIPGGEPK